MMSSDEQVGQAATGVQTLRLKVKAEAYRYLKAAAIENNPARMLSVGNALSVHS